MVGATRGWRAEHALPEALVVMPALEILRDAWWRHRHPDLPPRSELVAAAAARYGIPVLTAWPDLTEPIRMAA